MKYLEVCAAVVFKDDRLLLATRRPGGSLAGLWEFPGGKQQSDETLENCIVRELREELGAEVEEASELFSFIHVYPEKTVRLHFMECRLGKDRTLFGREGQMFAWFTPSELEELSWTPADREVWAWFCHSDGLTEHPNLTLSDAVRTAAVCRWFRDEPMEE